MPWGFFSWVDFVSFMLRKHGGQECHVAMRSECIVEKSMVHKWPYWCHINGLLHWWQALDEGSEENYYLEY